jgi:Lon protease-like protein
MAIQHDVPLFPLGTVLFPEGRLPLKIFEQRYMDMAKACLKNDSPFGVCLIASGRETGAPALSHEVGTLARIARWDMPQLGVLQVRCHGEQRFRVVSRRVETSGLQRADIEVAEDLRPAPLEARHEFLASLLSRIIDQIGDVPYFQPPRFGDSVWVGYRLCELLPIALPDKQKLLELDDHVVRLDAVHRFLLDKGLLNPSR